MKTVLNNTLATALSKIKLQKVQTVLAILLIGFACTFLFSCKASRETICIIPPTVEIVKPIPQFAKATINGVVIDKNGIPLENATVSFDGSTVTNTNTSGTFSFEIEKNINFNYQLVVQKEGLNNSVRTYHTQMGNAAYTIQMAKPCACDSIKNNCLSKHSFNFRNNSDDIDATHKEMLNQIIDCLKQDPEMEIAVINNLMDANKLLAKDRLQTVVRYFVSKGISENRISRKLQRAVAGNANDIDIIPNKQ